jgi:hypothetical protein
MTVEHGTSSDNQLHELLHTAAEIAAQPSSRR